MLGLGEREGLKDAAFFGVLCAPRPIVRSMKTQPRTQRAFCNFPGLLAPDKIARPACQTVSRLQVPHSRKDFVLQSHPWAIGSVSLFEDPGGQRCSLYTPGIAGKLRYLEKYVKQLGLPDLKLNSSPFSLRFVPFLGTVLISDFESALGILGF